METKTTLAIIPGLVNIGSDLEGDIQDVRLILFGINVFLFMYIYVNDVYCN
jgi:hypothetical protein